MFSFASSCGFRFCRGGPDPQGQENSFPVGDDLVSARGCLHYLCRLLTFHSGLRQAKPLQRMVLRVSSGICNPRGVDYGYTIRADVLFISSLHEQRRNRTKEETRRLIAKKLKIKACFPKLAKRPRSARLDEARSSRKTSSIFFTLFC